MKKNLMAACGVLCAVAMMAPAVGATEVAADGWKIGAGIVTNVEKADNATADADGTIQGYSTMAAVVVDPSGVITDCAIDVAQTNITFNAEGAITTDLAAECLTKVEKGEDYGMRPASAIGKEWFEQAEAFSQFCIGKTVDEVAAIELEDGKPTDVDLVAGCTMSCGDMQAAVIKAINYATPAADCTDAEVKLAIVTDITGSKDATAEEDGDAYFYNTYVAAAVAADGTVNGCYIDASQLHCGFNAAGEVNADMVVTDSKSKNELGEEYGMKPASPIGLEWNEQAAGFAQYATGKNIADLAGMELDAEGHAVDADALATATIHVNSWVAAFAKMQ